MSIPIEPYILQLYHIGAVKFGQFTLKSGILSPLYIDLRLLVSYPTLLKEIASLMWDKVSIRHYNRICGVPYTALPIATAISLSQHIPMVMRRKEMKDYGTKKMIEGAFEKGENYLVIEDLITSGSSVVETAQLLEEEGLTVTDIVVLIDRQQGGKEKLEQKGYRLHPVFTLQELLHTLEKEGKISKDTVQDVDAFIEANRC